MSDAKSKVQVKNMLRTLSGTNVPTADGALPVEEVDAEVRAWLDQGFELAGVQYAGDTPGGVRILYVLVKYADG